MKQFRMNVSDTARRMVFAALLAFALEGQSAAGVAPGQVDASYRPSLDERVTHLVRQPDGQILVAGLFSSINGVPQAFLARLTAGGALDLSFRPQITGELSALGVGPDGRIVLAGDFSTVNGVARCVAYPFVPKLRS